MASEESSIPFGRRLRYRAEYFLARGGLLLMDRLSPRGAIRAAAAMGRAWFVLHGSRRRQAVENVLAAGVASDPAQARRIARDSFAHFAMTVAEAVKMGDALSAPGWRDRFEWMVPPATEALLRDSRTGAILLTGHVGSWAVAGYVLSRAKTVNGIMKPPYNPYTNRLLGERMRFDSLRVIPKHDANPARLLSVLKRGEVLALLFDQHAMGQPVEIEFFGRPAATYASAALLHLVSGAAIVFGTCIRTGPMRFRLELSEPLRFPRTGDRDRDVRSVLADVSGRLEAVVRAHPEQYLWAHRRWRTKHPPAA
jgi:KDO2-lipid IV(A) lauroyltransferase